MNKSNWKEENGALHCSIETESYAEATAAVVSIAMLADKQNHHPTITLEYDRLIIRLSTHDEGNTVTDKDRKLANAIDALY